MAELAKGGIQPENQEARKAQQAAEERTFESQLGNLLRAGVILASSVVLAGGIVYLIRHSVQVPKYGTFVGEPKDITSFSGIFGQVLAGSGRGIIQLGLLLLIATPIARVIFAALIFAKYRDWLYVAFTAVVLGFLGYGLAGGHL